MIYRFFFSSSLIFFFIFSLEQALSSQSPKCPDIKEVREAIEVLSKEAKDNSSKDIFDLHPEWNNSPQCVEKIFRAYITVPEKSKKDQAVQKPTLKADLMGMRKGFSDALKVFSTLKKPEEAVPQEVKILNDVKFVRMHNSKRPELVILYLHGGGYILGYDDVKGLYTDMLSKLVNDLKAEVYMPYYRTRPEAPLNASLEDAYRAYKALTKIGIKPEGIVLMGDSAGGGLALRLLLKLKQENEGMPRMAVLLSPWSDLTNSGKSMQKNAGKDMFSSIDGLDLFTKEVLGKSDPKDPMISPLFGDYTGFPKLLYVVSGTEIFRDDTLRDMEKAKRQGVQVDLILHDDGIHVYPVFARFLKSGREALGQMIKKIKTEK